MLRTKGWDACETDVTNAFFYGDSKEILYMRLPKGYKSFAKMIKRDSTYVQRTIKACKLKKRHYGLK